VSTPNEWNLLKHQFDALVHNETLDADSIEKTLDYQVRRRFVELINRAAKPSNGTGSPALQRAISWRFEDEPT
jgi:hypothetical protein